MKLTPGDLKPLKYNFKTITFQSSNLLVYDIGKYLLIQHASSWTSSLILYCHRWLIEAGMGGGTKSDYILPLPMVYCISMHENDYW